MIFPSLSLTKRYFKIKSDGCIIDISLYKKDSTYVDKIHYNEDDSINEKECSEIFPCIKLEGILNGSTEKVTVYLWLDYLIDIGDTFNGKFRCYDDNKEIDKYIEYFNTEVENDVYKKLLNGYSFEYLKSIYPVYLFEIGDGLVFYYDGKTIIVNKITTSDGIELICLKKDELEKNKVDKAYEIVAEETTNYANQLLSKYGIIEKCEITKNELKQ